MIRLLSRHRHGQTGPSLRRLLRARSGRHAGTPRRRLRQGGRGRRSVPDPRCGPRDADPLGVDGRLPPDSALGTPVRVTHPQPSSWKLVSNADSRQVLRLRLTDLPGWHASIDGRPVPLQSFCRVDDPARGTSRATHRRAVLLAGDLHCRSRPRRDRGPRHWRRICCHAEPQQATRQQGAFCGRASMSPRERED